MKVEFDEIDNNGTSKIYVQDIDDGKIKNDYDFSEEQTLFNTPN